VAIESLPAFTAPARRRWDAIPARIRQRLLANVWCGNCARETTVTDFTGRIQRGHLLLVGRCTRCRGEVARLIEAR
jgi:hypothetical protein